MTKIISIICYCLQLHRLAYFLNRNRKRTITFHNVLTDDVFFPNVANGVSNSLSQFKTIIDEISKHFEFSLDLDDPKTVTITFDDGYRNQVEVAAPYLISKGIPAYLFVSGALLESIDHQLPMTKIGGETLVVDLLLHWVSYAPDGIYSVRFGNKDVSFELCDNDRLTVWSAVIWPAFVDDAKSKGGDVLNALNAAYPMDKVIKSLPKRYVEQRLKGPKDVQLVELMYKGWEIGWHTLSHYPLSLLSHDEKVAELTPDHRCMSKVLSFPYGGPKEVDSDCLEIVESIGFEDAVSNVNTKNKLTSSFFRSRMSLPSNKVMLHFELSGLKHLIKYRKLLPKI